MKSLLGNDESYMTKVREYNAWRKEASKHPLPESKPIHFPEYVTRNDIYPEHSNYHGD